MLFALLTKIFKSTSFFPYHKEHCQSRDDRSMLDECITLSAQYFSVNFQCMGLVFPNALKLKDGQVISSQFIVLKWILVGPESRRINMLVFDFLTNRQRECEKWPKQRQMK